MNRITVMLVEEKYRIAQEAAKQLGMTAEAYIESLIDAAQVSFEEILKPMRDRFKNSGRTEGELDEAVNESRRARVEAAPVSPETSDDLNAGDVAAIEESEAQIARGEDIDWKQASKDLRKKYLGS